MRDAMGCGRWDGRAERGGEKGRKGPAEKGVTKELLRKFSEEL